MNSNQVVGGRTFTITRQALDGSGQPVSGYVGASNSFNFVDNLGTIWSAVMGGWSNGRAIFTLTAPVVSAPIVRTLTPTYTDPSVLFAPGPVTLTVIPPYQGKFNLQNAVLAYDFAGVDGHNIAYDYSSSGYHMQTLDGSTIPTLFTEASTILAKGHGSTLGRKALGYTLNYNGYAYSVAKKLTLSSATAPLIIKPVAPADPMPIKTISFVLWRSSAAALCATVLRYVWGGGGITVGLTNNGTSDFTVKVYLNAVLAQTISANLAGVVASSYADKAELSLFDSAIGGVGMNNPLGIGMLSFACYSDAKDTNFIAAQASAWGLT